MWKVTWPCWTSVQSAAGPTTIPSSSRGWKPGRGATLNQHPAELNCRGLDSRGKLLMRQSRAPRVPWHAVASSSNGGWLACCASDSRGKPSTKQELFKLQAGVPAVPLIMLHVSPGRRTFHSSHRRAFGAKVPHERAQVETSQLRSSSARMTAVAPLQLLISKAKNTKEGGVVTGGASGARTEICV